MTQYEAIQSCLRCLRSKTDFVPKVALILGSGLGDFGERVKTSCTVDYADIEGFPLSTAPGHKGRFIFGYVNDTPVVVMQGRVHLYEGYSPEQVALPIRLMGLLGAKALFLTNAAGGANPSFSAGDLMLITDQISCFVPSPLIGENVSELGTRFPDMTKIYDGELCDILRRAASESCVLLREGVYLQLRGPQFESPAEVRACSILGADAIGMSTAIEAIAARHMGLRVCGISCITNLAAGIAEHPLSQEEVMEAGAHVAEQFATVVSRSITAMGDIL